MRHASRFVLRGPRTVRDMEYPTLASERITLRIVQVSVVGLVLALGFLAGVVCGL